MSLKKCRSNSHFLSKIWRIWIQIWMHPSEICLKLTEPYPNSKTVCLNENIYNFWWRKGLEAGAFHKKASNTSEIKLLSLFWWFFRSPLPAEELLYGGLNMALILTSLFVCSRTSPYQNWGMWHPWSESLESPLLSTIYFNKRSSKFSFVLRARANLDLRRF